MEKTQEFQIVYTALTNLCQHSTTDLVRGMMLNERKQSALSKALSWNILKLKLLPCIQFITNKQLKLVPVTW